MCSLHGSDVKIYLNQLCFDGGTLAKEKMDEFLSKGYKLTEKEQAIWYKMEDILLKIKTECLDEYHPEFQYSLYQIDEEINLKFSRALKGWHEPNMVTKYGDLSSLVDTLFEYEFLR